VSRFERPQIAWVCFGAGALAAAALIGLEARGTTFSGDEWAYLHRLAHEPFSSALFEAPPGQYLIAIPMLLYAALANVLGTDSYLPFRVAGLLMLVLASGLLFELTRRRVGYLAALPAPIVLLVFGAAYEVVVIPMRLPSLISVCAGLGLLLALERRDVRRDVTACALGIVSVLSHPVSLAFVAAAAVRVTFADRRFSLRRSWVAIVPAAIFGLWMITLRVPIEGAPRPTLDHVAPFSAELFVAVAAALTGAFRFPWMDGVDFIHWWTVAIAIVLVVLAGIVVIRARRISIELAAASVALAVGVVSPALTPWAVLRMPEAPRYLYPAAILLVLVAVEVAGMRLPGRRTRLIAGALVGVIFASALYANVTLLRERARGYAESSAVLKAELGALDLARTDVPPARQPDSPATSDPTNLVELIFAHGATGEVAARARADSAPVYYEIADAFGSPGFGVSALLALKPSTRVQVDRVLLEVTEVELRVAPAGSQSPLPDRSSQGRLATRGCVRAAEGRPLVVSSGEAIWIEPEGRAPPELRIGRFADDPVVSLEWPGNSKAATLSLPSTNLDDLGWKLDVPTGEPILTCAVGKDDADVRP
jgi:hypothetical protein